MSTFDEERQAFRDFLAQASAEVATWPKWKQNILGYVPDKIDSQEERLASAPSLARAEGVNSTCE